MVYSGMQMLDWRVASTPVLYCSLGARSAVRTIAQFGSALDWGVKGSRVQIPLVRPKRAEIQRFPPFCFSGEMPSGTLRVHCGSHLSLFASFVWIDDIGVIGQNMCLASRCFSMVCWCGIRFSRCRCRIWRECRRLAACFRRCAPMPVSRVVRSARRAMRGGLAMRRFRGARCAGGITSTRP